jgi:hypothetical protein
VATASPDQSPKPNGTERHENGRFGPGNKGRPPGIPTKKFLEIRQVSRQILLGDAPEVYIKNIRKRIRDGEAPHMEKFFAEHLWGKPRDVIEMHGLTLNFFKVVYVDNSEGAPGQTAQDAADDDRTLTIRAEPSQRVESHHPDELPSQELPAGVPPGDAGGMQTWDARLAPAFRKRDY